MHDTWILWVIFYAEKAPSQIVCFFCDGVLEAGAEKGSILFEGDVTPLKTNPDKGTISK